MSKRIIDRIARLVNEGGLSLEEAVEIEAPGADVAYWQHQLNRYDPNPLAKKRRPARRRSGGKRKRTSRLVLESSQNWALAKLVSRVNKGDGDETD